MKLQYLKQKSSLDELTAHEGGGHLKLTEIRQYLERENFFKKKLPEPQGLVGKGIMCM